MHKKLVLIFFGILVLAIAAVLVVIFILKPGKESDSDTSQTSISGGGASVGTDNSVAMNSQNGITKDDDWIYYWYTEDQYYIYRINIQNGKAERWLEDSTTCIYTADGWVYYQNASDHNHIYKIRADGSGKQQLKCIK